MNVAAMLSNILGRVDLSGFAIGFSAHDKVRNFIISMMLLIYQPF